MDNCNRGVEMERVTAISVRASRQYVNAVNALATLWGVDTGDLVRRALDEMHGKDIEKQLSFFTDDNPHIDRNIDKSKERS